MDRYLFDQNVKLYYEWLTRVHCQMIKNDSLDKYLYRRALMFAYADYYINSLDIDRDHVFDMLLMDNDDREEYLRIKGG